MPHSVFLKWMPYLFGLWIEGILYVTFAHDPQVSDDLDGGRPQHVVLYVGQGLTGSHHNGLSGVNPQGVHILHVTNLEEKQ